ncbi:hypothetical protein EW026_g995 [Hermanssonia centrifuga]|uniref:Phosphotransferase n=1 Tax=Hermanssonia centrifuga TaxID=98765 RepID=A0A4S4KSX3_9APHY|nr:hypothetical protein EW026_g995 [Hermanssonia centrifuga]
MAPTSAFLKDDGHQTFDSIAAQFQLDDEALHTITKQFLEDFRLGLSEYNHPMAMIPTFVTGVPNGSETGTFLALDLGGTNLRVCEVRLLGNHEFTLRQQKYRVSDALKTGEASVLFAAIVGAIFGTGTNGAYVEKVSNIAKLGDSPARLNGGEMVINAEWGAFNNTRTTLPTTVFDNKLDRESINPRLQAFEKFISGMYLGEITRNVLLSLIDAAPHPLLFNGRSSAQLNGHYGLDTAIISEVEQIWESGRPPIASVKSVEGGTSLDDPSGSSRDTSSLSSTQVNGVGNIPHFLDIDAHSEEDRARLERIRSILIQRLHLDPEHVSLRDAAVVRWAASLVANRAAKLSSCSIAAVLVQTGRAELGGGLTPQDEHIIIGVDGRCSPNSLIEHYPNFNANLRTSLRRLVGEEVESRVDIGMAKDGSGVGAALCALQAIKQGL